MALSTPVGLYRLLVPTLGVLAVCRISQTLLKCAWPSKRLLLGEAPRVARRHRRICHEPSAKAAAKLINEGDWDQIWERCRVPQATCGNLHSDPAHQRQAHLVLRGVGALVRALLSQIDLLLAKRKYQLRLRQIANQYHPLPPEDVIVIGSQRKAIVEGNSNLTALLPAQMRLSLPTRRDLLHHPLHLPSFEAKLMARVTVRATAETAMSPATKRKRKRVRKTILFTVPVNVLASAK